MQAALASRAVELGEHSIMRSHNNTKHGSRHSARGFGLIEALIALLVVSFGMLAIASFQMTLFRSSDVAKQRTEATRLAQQKMEQLRAYARVESHSGTPHIVNYTDDVVSSTAPEVVSTNADFSRTWVVTANSANTEKWVNVMVDWTDRTGTPQRVQLFSVISKYDPQDLGALSAYVPGSVGSQLRPKNRNINVPYPAVNLASCPGGTGACSAFTPPPGNVIYVFDNNSGNITGSCTPVAYTIASFSGTGTTVTITTTMAHGFVVGDQVTIAGAATAFNGNFTVTGAPSTTTFTYSVATAFATTVSGSGGSATKVVTLVDGVDLTTVPGLTCTNMSAYLLSGYVRFDTSNNPSGDEPGNVGSNNDTRPLNGSTPLSLDTSNFSGGGTPSMTCYAQQQKVVTTNSTAVTISSLSRSGNTVTVNATGHGYLAGDIVAINEVSPSAFIGAFTVLSASANSFTYRMPPPLPTATSGTGGYAKKVERLTIPETSNVSGYSTVAARFVSYACVVTPVDHDNSASTPNRWWGRVTLNPSGWTIGNSGSEFRVCRYSADYNGSSSVSNSEHPLWYRAVTSALDTQNYLVVQGSRSCPTDSPQNFGSPFNASDDSTIIHQPSGARSNFESASTGADIPMD
jgi:type IV pilus modification protein PilV